MTKRPTRNELFIELATTVSRRATCDRARVGCVLVKEDRVIATGYNGSPPGMSHCDDVGHDMEATHCIRTIHAEENAIIQCALNGVSPVGSTCYSTIIPCIRCAYRLYASGIKKYIFKNIYRFDTEESIRRWIDLLKAGSTLYQLNTVDDKFELEEITISIILERLARGTNSND